MASARGVSWSDIVEDDDDDLSNPLPEPEIEVVYMRRRRSSIRDSEEVVVERRSSGFTRLSLAPVPRISWNRSLSTRGRTSITVNSFKVNQPQQGKSRKKAKPPLPKKKAVPQPSFDKEKAYFQEVDSFELLEESPSPKKPSTWIMGAPNEKIVLPKLSSMLQKWLIAQRRGLGPPPSLARILETPATRKKSLDSRLASGEASFQLRPRGHSIPSRIDFSPTSEDVSIGRAPSEHNDEDCGEIDLVVSKLSLSSNTASVDDQSWDPFMALLTACGQSAPSTFSNAFLAYSDNEAIKKVGEGTFGEAFKVGQTVCKIVPFNGDIRVNGELQKQAEELLEEVMLSCTLNQLRSCDNHVLNACNSFIQTIDLRVCKGQYDAALVKAWEDWDERNGSENDHPEQFPENQSYVVFVQEHGGQDLESFVLLNFDEACSLLLQVTFALAVAEAAYEFEHRDLHWGNILVKRKDVEMLSFKLEGRDFSVRTYGLSISIIDFTLSRINTGEDILFLDLSSDPELFEGPKGDKQFDTYRKMREVTEDCWEGSFPKTNILWMQYVVDILLLKKSFERTNKNERELRSLRKRLNSYGSAKEATSDPFFSDMIIQSI